MKCARICTLAATLALAGCVAQASGLREVPAGDALLAESGLDENGAWQSAPFTRARWIPYDARGRVVVHHGLGRTPTSVEVYLSGDDDDSGEQNTRNSFVGSGNLVTIVEVDEDAVTLHNNTPGDFHIRVVLR